MTARLSPLQRQVLEQLAHIRVAPEDAWMTTKRLSTLTGRNVSWTWDTLNRLWDRGFVLAEGSGLNSEYRWRITGKGREALT